MPTTNPPVIEIRQGERPPITVFRNDYWPDGICPTQAEFRLKVRWQARRIKRRLGRAVAVLIRGDYFAVIVILT